MSSLVDATAALSVTDERPDALAPAPPTCVPSDNSHRSPPGIAAGRVTRRRFDAEPGVHIKLDKRGDGVAPVEGDTVQVNYSGRVKGKKTEFDKNDGGYPFEFTLGERKVVAGWESALPKLRVGDHATLTLAPEFGYGETGDSDDIPPNVLHCAYIKLSRRVCHRRDASSMRGGAPDSLFDLRTGHTHLQS